MRPLAGWSTLFYLAKMYFRTQMEYRGAFLINRLSQIVSYGAAFASIWVLLARFDTLGGWTWPQLALLLSFQLLAYSLGAAFSFVQFRDLETMVRLGTFDTILVKPISPWAYMTFSGLNVDYIGHIALAVGLMVWSLSAAEVHWTLPMALYFVGALISAAILVAVIMTIIGASALVIVQSSYLFSIFFGFWEMGRYPINIYPVALQWLLLTVMPLGFMNYVPVAVFLGKDVVILGVWGWAASLLVGPIAIGIGMAIWRYCIRNYQGAGG